MRWLQTARGWLDDLHRSWHRPRPSPPAPRTAASAPVSYGPLERVLLTDGVGRTLFEEFANHRAEARGDEETGWLLLGLREAREAIVVATLPAGTRRGVRDELDAVQRDFREHRGVSVILYDQVCATEKRRRRKRGKMAAAPMRVMINPLEIGRAHV